MLKINKENLVMQSVQGEVYHPRTPIQYRIDPNGLAHAVPATGAICYNVEIGDDCMKWAGCHIEPGVTTKNTDEMFNTAYIFLSCVGNRAKVITGDAKGAIGYVTGTHGGVEHTMIYFPKDVLEDLNIGDKIAVKAFGQGLELIDYPDIHCMSLDPDMLLSWNVEEKDGKLYVPVVATVPAYMMGSGVGGNTAYSGDYDIMNDDPKTLKELGLDHLKYGDLVYLEDCDNTYGRGYLKGAGTVGVIVHGGCIKAGHGPGVTALMSCKNDTLQPKLDPNANIQHYIKGQYK